MYFYSVVLYCYHAVFVSSTLTIFLCKYVCMCNLCIYIGNCILLCCNHDVLLDNSLNILCMLCENVCMTLYV